jgi:hypothetical protein
MTQEYVWILDASSGSIYKMFVPKWWGESEESYEELIEVSLPDDVRMKDCDWMLCDSLEVQCIYPYQKEKDNVE